MNRENEVANYQGDVAHEPSLGDVLMRTSSALNEALNLAEQIIDRIRPSQPTAVQTGPGANGVSAPNLTSLVHSTNNQAQRLIDELNGILSRL